MEKTGQQHKPLQLQVNMEQTRRGEGRDLGRGGAVYILGRGDRN